MSSISPGTTGTETAVTKVFNDLLLAADDGEISAIWFLVGLGHFLLVVLEPMSLSLTVSEIFSGECDAFVGMTLNDLKTKVKVIHIGTNRFLT